MLFILYIVLHFSNIAYGNKDDEEFKRYIRDDNYKMPIFGSYMFDPMKQEFEVTHDPKKDGPVPTTTTTTTTTTTSRGPMSAENQSGDKNHDSYTTTARSPSPTTTAKDHGTHGPVGPSDRDISDEHHDKNKRPGADKSEESVSHVDTRTQAPFRKHVRSKDSIELLQNSIVSKSKIRRRQPKIDDKYNQTGYRYQPVSLTI